MKISHLLAFVVIGSLVVSVVVAQSPSPTASSSGNIRDAVKQKVSEELANIKQAVAKRAYVGTISAKSELTLTITNLKNQSRTATVTTDTTIKLTGGKDGTPADLKVGDFIIAMGDVDSNGVLTTKRLLVIAQPETDNRDSVFLTITKVSASALTGENLKKETWTIKLTSAAKATDVKVGSKIVAVGTVSASTLSANLIHLLPSN